MKKDGRGGHSGGEAAGRETYQGGRTLAWTCARVSRTRGLATPWCMHGFRWFIWGMFVTLANTPLVPKLPNFGGAGGTG
jgi:hypothetical protein